MGEATVIMHIMLIVLQIVLLRKKFKPVQFLQLLVAFIFGFFVDLTLFLVSAEIQVSNYLFQWILCLCSCALVAFGVYLEVKAKVTYMAGEGLALAVAEVFHTEFGKAKIGVDSALVVIGVISSFVIFHNLLGIREGTLASALLVGTLVRVYDKKLKFIDTLLDGKADEKIIVQTGEINRKNKLIITIAREFGSGGYEIGKLVAEKFGISFYDKKLINLSAAVGGLTPEYVKEHEQKLTHGVIHELYEQNYAFINGEMPQQDLLFMAQSKVIRDICGRESCVVVGRCADFVLKDYPQCINIFIHADKKYRIRRIIEEYNVDPDMAEKELGRVDRGRTNYYRYYTRKMRGEAANYHLTIDSSFFGAEGAAILIADTVEQYFGLVHSPKACLRPERRKTAGITLL